MATLQVPSRQVAVAFQEEPAPRRDGALLTNEAGLRRKNPRWPLVEQVVRELEPGLGNSYCCLELPCGTYIQAMRGFKGFHLERRLTGSDYHGGYVHLRACYPKGSPEREALWKLDGGNAGQHRDLLLPDDVVDAFRDFYRGADGCGWLEWRPLEL